MTEKSIHPADRIISQLRIPLLSLILLLSFLMPAGAFAQYEERLSLNGTWGYVPSGAAFRTLEVPGFFVWDRLPDGGGYFEGGDGPVWRIIEGIPEGTYQKTFNIPASMAGKKKFIHFEAVNFFARVSVNGVHVGTHIGGFLPFEFDMTETVYTPSSGNSISVEIIYWDYDQFLDSATDLPAWPTGSFCHAHNLGITGDVWIAARPAVYVDDCFVQTSVRNDQIRTTCSLINADDSPYAVTLVPQVLDGSIIARSIPAQQVTVPAQDTVEVVMEAAWSNPELWYPNHPKLYTFRIGIEHNGSRINQFDQTFGFREFWIEGSHFMLNGIRQNLRGDNLDFHSLKPYWIYLVPDIDTWSSVLDSLQALNFNVVRFHKEPAPPAFLDLCDERGMMVIGESAIHGVAGVGGPPGRHSTAYVTNSIEWCREWVRRDRNHPSIIMWSASNEIVWPTFKMWTDDLKRVGAAIRELDHTRPVYYEGEQDLNGDADVFCWHYMLFFPSAWPPDGIYDGMTEFVDGSLPTSWGEFDWTRNLFSPNTWVRRQALKTRGARVIGVADVRPYRLDWAWHPNPDYREIYNDFTASPEQKQFLRNTMNPLLVFDKDYYEHQEFPSAPQYDEGESIERTLVIFNDEYYGEDIEIQWRVLVDDEVASYGSFSALIPVGTHVERTLTFEAPYVPDDSDFDLELSSWKFGQRHFLERTIFRSRDTGLAPPRAVEDLRVENDPSGARVSWSPVTLTQDGNSVSISHYILYKCSDCLFGGSNTESVAVSSGTIYNDVLGGIKGNPSENRFYRVTAVDNGGLISTPSEIVGVFDFSLLASAPYQFNSIALPLSSGMDDAETLRQAISGATSVAAWDGIAQGYIQYLPSVPATNFSLTEGGAYFVTVSQSSTLTFFGPAVFPEFQLTKNGSGSSFHTLMLPLDKPFITSASALLADISNCNGVAFWNSQIQGYDQYIPDIPLTDFSVQPGHAYFVSVSQSTTWPQTGKINTAVRSLGASDIGEAPHAVWGRYEAPEGGSLKFTAYIESRPNEIIDETSPGSRMENGFWIVQCAGFSIRSKGETLCVQFTLDGGKAGTFRTVLTDSPADYAGEIRLESVEEYATPEDFSLGPNYPNPFNGTTHFHYTLAERGHVRITIHNLLGRRIALLIDEAQDAGRYRSGWNATDDRGTPVESGVYLLRFETAKNQITRKLILIR